MPLLVVGAVLVLAAGACAALGYKGFQALTAPVDAANRWVDAAQAGDVDAMGQLACRAGDPEADLRTLDVAHWGHAQQLNHSSIVNGRAEVSGSISYRGERTPITLALVRTDTRGHEGWCVNGVRLGEAPRSVDPFRTD